MPRSLATDLRAVEAELVGFEEDATLADEANLNGRAKALDFISFVNEVARVQRDATEFACLQRRADALRVRLTTINDRVFRRVRGEIRSRHWTKPQLRQELDRYTIYSPSGEGQVHLGYDGLDVLLSAIFAVPEQPVTTIEQQPEMVHYEPTPARVILDLIDHVDLNGNDVFYDLGSGLGRVVILIGLLTGIRAKGIEYQPTFCSYAQRCAADVGLSNAEFVNADARAVDYTDGSVFYLFTPFRGKMLQAVLDRLRQQAERRTITICTYGSCTRHLFTLPWLSSTDASANHDYRLATFHSR